MTPETCCGARCRHCDVWRTQEWELRLGDCIAGMRELADDSVDVTITDPPYEYEAHTNGKRQNITPGRGKNERGTKVYARVVDRGFEFNAITDDQRHASAAQIARVTRHCAIVFCQVEAVAAWRDALNVDGLKYRRAIPWVKPDAMPSLHGRWPGQAVEMLVLATKEQGARVCPVGGKARYYEITRERGLTRAHDTAKPLDLMLSVVDDFSRTGDLVLDPFSGSGTTGVACRILGRRFLGWELNAEYHAIATRRLSGDEAKPRPEQPSLFGATKP